jgi:hypothetical protein
MRLYLPEEKRKHAEQSRSDHQPEGQSAVVAGFPHKRARAKTSQNKQVIGDHVLERDKGYKSKSGAEGDRKEGLHGYVVDV